MFGMVFKDLVRLVACLNDATANLLEHFGTFDRKVVFFCLHATQTHSHSAYTLLYGTTLHTIQLMNYHIASSLDTGLPTSPLPLQKLSQLSQENCQVLQNSGGSDTLSLLSWPPTLFSALLSRMQRRYKPGKISSKEIRLGYIRLSYITLTLHSSIR